MKNLLLTAPLLFLSLFLGSCSHTEKPETTFYREFNIGRSIEGLHNSHLQSRTGGMSVATSIGELTKRRRSGELEYSIIRVEKDDFDNEAFLDALKSAIRFQIESSEIKIVQAETKGDRFYFEYGQIPQNQGSVEVIGTVLSDDRYKLWYSIQETAGIDSSDRASMQ